MKFIIFILSSLTLSAAEVSLVWNPISGASGYKIHYGTSHATYTTNFEVGNVTNFTVTNLTYNTLYYFSVTDDEEIQGDFSNEITGLAYGLFISPTVAVDGTITINRNMESLCSIYLLSSGEWVLHGTTTNATYQVSLNGFKPTPIKIDETIITNLVFSRLLLR